jgi:pyrroloquinoline quinone (PQQ) biosynthesis protein C
MTITLELENNKKSFSQHLSERILPTLIERGKIWQKLAHQKNFAQFYATVLVQSYHYVKQSCPLMEKAVSDHLTDARYDFLRAYLQNHILEEAGHDEWLLQDIENLGYSRDLAIRSIPLNAVCNMVGTQLYLMAEFGGVALLGYIFVLEAYPPKSNFLTELSETHSIPIDAFSTFFEHSDIDVRHAGELMEILNSSQLTNKDRQLIEYSAQSAVEATYLLFNQISQSQQWLPADLKTSGASQKRSKSHA